MALFGAAKGGIRSPHPIPKPNPAQTNPPAGTAKKSTNKDFEAPPEVCERFPFLLSKPLVRSRSFSDIRQPFTQKGAKKEIRAEPPAQSPAIEKWAFGKIDRAPSGFMNSSLSIPFQSEVSHSEGQDHFRIGQGAEKELFGRVAVTPKSQNSTARGVILEAAENSDLGTSKRSQPNDNSFALPQNLIFISSGHKDVYSSGTRGIFTDPPSSGKIGETDETLSFLWELARQAIQPKVSIHLLLGIINLGTFFLRTKAHLRNAIQGNHPRDPANVLQIAVSQVPSAVIQSIANEAARGAVNALSHRISPPPPLAGPPPPPAPPPPARPLSVRRMTPEEILEIENQIQACREQIPTLRDLMNALMQANKTGYARLYTTWFKIWELGKAGARNFHQAVGRRARGSLLTNRGPLSTDEKAGMPAKSKTKF